MAGMSNSSERSNSSDDTIQVASRAPSHPASRVDQPSEENEELERERAAMRNAMDVDPSTYTGKGKARERVDIKDEEVDMKDEDRSFVEVGEEVEEYEPISEDEPTEGENDLFDDDDGHSHISLSSDGETRPEVSGISDRPWLSMDLHGRREYERMFCNLTSYPMGGSWSMTEDYQHELDKLMVQYINDFPLREWLMPRAEAEQVYDRFMERMKWRDLGTKIYGAQPQGPAFTPTMSHGPRALSHHPPPMHPPQYPMPPQQVLHSQPHAQPMPVNQGIQMGHPVRQPMGFAQQQEHRRYTQGNVPQAVGPVPQPHHRPPPGFVAAPAPVAPPRPDIASAKNNRPVARPSNTGMRLDESSPANSPPPNVPVPPYPLRQKPENRKTLSKIGRGKTRRPAEAEVFPWNRKMDFHQARIAARSKDTWNLKIYDKETLDNIKLTQERNKPIIEKLEAVITEKQRKQLKPRAQESQVLAQDDIVDAPLSGISRTAKKNVTTPEPANTNADEAPPKKTSRRRALPESSEPNDANSDPYHSGNFAWASNEDQQTATVLGAHSPDSMIAQGEADRFLAEELGRVKIMWNPGKKGTSSELRQAIFSVRDTVMTRKQLAETPILNRAAAECIIDFCPDLLWRDILLRILSEGAFSNKEIRERFCLNGAHSDRATVAKRLSAALGKDTNPPRGGGQEEVDDWHDGNRDDFDKYQAFFGKRPPARRSGKSMKSKREAAENSNAESSPAKRMMLESSSTAAAPSIDGATESRPVQPESSIQAATKPEGGEDDRDAVSVQNSDELDAMSD